jgi:hypothetical protein
MINSASSFSSTILFCSIAYDYKSIQKKPNKYIRHPSSPEFKLRSISSQTPADLSRLPGSRGNEKSPPRPLFLIFPSTPYYSSLHAPCPPSRVAVCSPGPPAPPFWPFSTSKRQWLPPDGKTAPSSSLYFTPPLNAEGTEVDLWIVFWCVGRLCAYLFCLL